MNRRDFLRLGAAATAGALAGRALGQSAAHPTSQPATRPALAAKLPRWRGFNLLEKFYNAQNHPYRESDFALIAEWGFNFVRLPMSYWCWSDPAAPLTLREPVLKEIDQAVAWGRQYGVHVNLNLHRLPGYCVNPPPEPASLWTDPAALEAAAFQWGHLAQRYKGVPSSQVSFNLINEPPADHPQTYVAVTARLVGAVRDVDADRLIIVDGAAWGTRPLPDLLPLGVAQSLHTYTPMQLTHYRASWIHGNNNWPLPSWPLTIDNGSGKIETWNRARLRREMVQPWQKLAASGIGVHVGEWGCYRYTPHAAVLAWMADCLSLWREAGFGWSLWNLRGEFGPLDSHRTDVQYENFRGHQLDRAMLERLRGD